MTLRLRTSLRCVLRRKLLALLAVFLVATGANLRVPERAVHTGPDGGADDPANWVAGNFTCR